MSFATARAEFENYCQHIAGHEEDSQIVTSHMYPPIPDRRWDWCAYLDGDEEDAGRYGWGRTEAEAVADLKVVLEADEETP